jgi:hypothetical protein
MIDTMLGRTISHYRTIEKLGTVPDLYVVEGLK